MTESESQFVGEGRLRLVDGLLAAFDQVRNGGTPLWISLEADSGWGKTRVVSEFYRRLAENQSSPRYWPGTLTRADTGLQERRKAISPTHVNHLPGSLPDWGWWGIRGERGQSGSEAEALALSARQLLAHAPYYQLTLQKRRGWVRFLNDLGRATAQEGATQLEDGMVDAVLGSLAPGYSLAKHLGKVLGTQIKQSMEDTRTVEGAQLIFDEADFDSEQTTTLARTVIQLSSAGLPIVIVVEDLHLADGSLIALIQEVMASSAPVLLITTAWQGLLDDQRATSSLLTASAARLQRIRPTTETLWPCFPTGASLSALQPNELSTILLRAFPEASDKLVAAIQDQYVNPLGVELLLSIPRYRKSPSFLERDIKDLPHTLDGLYGAIWSELPEAVRKFIAIATLGTPARYQGDELILPAAWNTALVLESGLESELLLSTENIDYLGYGWVTAARGLLREFPEPQQLRLAATELGEYWRDTDDEVQQFWAVAARRSAGVIVAYSTRMDGVSLDEALNAAWLIVALANVSVPLAPEHALVAVLFLIEGPGQAARGRDWQLRLRLTDLALSGADPTSDNAFTLRAERITNLFYAWRIPLARAESTALLNQWQKTHPNEQLPGAWELTHEVLNFQPTDASADYFTEPAGHTDDAATRMDKWTTHEHLYRQNVLVNLNALGIQHGPGTEEHLSEVYYEGHKFDSAAFSVFFMQQTLREHERYRVIPDDSEFLYNVRHQLALALWDDGRPGEAVAINRDVLERHPAASDRFHTLIDFLQWRTDRGVPEDAFAIVESSLRDYPFAFGEDTQDADQRAFRLLCHLRIASIDTQVRTDFTEAIDDLVDTLQQRASARAESGIDLPVRYLHDLFRIRCLLRTPRQEEALKRFAALEQKDREVQDASSVCYHEYFSALDEVEPIRKHR
jgi:hypothetical protein